MKNTIKNKFKITAVFLVCAALVLLAARISFCNNYYSSDIECINARFNSSEEDRYSVDTLVFKYQNDKQEFIMYTSPDRVFLTGHLSKITFFGDTYYKFKAVSALPPLLHLTDWREEGDFKYVCVENKEDISKYDCGGKTPECANIGYVLENGETESCYIYIM